MVGLHSHLSDGFYYPIAHNIFVKFLMLYLVPFFFFISGVFYRNDSYKKLIFEKFSTIIKPVLFTVVFYNILFWDNDWYSIYCDIYGIITFFHFFLLSAICYLLSAICYLLSAIC
ncbi:hypothetical protein KP936_001582 [Salmonella enterica subsp. enterica serovar Cerro]